MKHQIGDRTYVRSLGINGTIEHIDWDNIYIPWLHPVQLLLDSPYDDTGHLMFRTVPMDLLPISEGNEQLVRNKSTGHAHRMEVNQPRNDRSKRRIQQIRGGSFLESVRYNDGVIFTQMSSHNTRTISIFAEEGKSSIEIIFGSGGD